MNLYDELEVSPAATPETIRAAYQSLVKRFHPDRNPGNRAAADRTQRVNDAYKILSDPTARERYDQETGAKGTNAAQAAEAARQQAESAARQQAKETARQQAEAAASEANDRRRREQARPRAETTSERASAGRPEERASQRRAEQPPEKNDADLALDRLPAPGRLIGTISLGLGLLAATATARIYADSGLSLKALASICVALTFLALGVYYLVYFKPSAANWWPERRRLNLSLVLGVMCVIGIFANSGWWAIAYFVGAVFFGALALQQYVALSKRGNLSKTRDRFR